MPYILFIRKSYPLYLWNIFSIQPSHLLYWHHICNSIPELLWQLCNALPTPVYSPHSNQSDPYKNNSISHLYKKKKKSDHAWLLAQCFLRLPILIRVRAKVLLWSLRPRTQLCFPFDHLLYNCTLCSAHTPLPCCRWSIPHTLVLGTLHLLLLPPRILFLQIPVKFMQNSSPSVSFPIDTQIAHLYVTLHPLFLLYSSRCLIPLDTVYIHLFVYVSPYRCRFHEASPFVVFIIMSSPLKAMPGTEWSPIHISGKMEERKDGRKEGILKTVLSVLYYI